jgi:hypothetical protein
MEKKHKVMLSVFVLLLLGFFSLAVAGIIPGTDGLGKPMVTDEVASIFGTRLMARGIELQGQPIEGFDSGLLIMAFPGLKGEDFDQVEALEGVYKFEDGELVFDRNTSQPMSSAERMVTEEGYRTLLVNISERLDKVPNDEQDVIEIIELIGTSTPVANNGALWASGDWEMTESKPVGTTFQYPKSLSSLYTKTALWPPTLEIVDEEYECTPMGSPTESAGRTEERKIAGTDYCVTEQKQGAAGTAYTDYTYAFEQGDKTAVLSFSLSQVQCGNYDSPEKELCETEQAGFDVDELATDIAGTLVFDTPAEGDQVFCTMDAKICPDGSYVGRVAPRCEFAPCPGN